MAACEGMLISRKPGKVMKRSKHVKLRLFVIQPAGTLYRLEAVAAGSLPAGCRGRAPSWCRRSDSVPSKQARRRKPAQKDVQSKPGDRLKYKKRDYERLFVHLQSHNCITKSSLALAQTRIGFVKLCDWPMPVLSHPIFLLGFCPTAQIFL